MHANAHNIIQTLHGYLETKACIDQKTFLITQDRYYIYCSVTILALLILKRTKENS
jgi:hypothetical protein